MYISSKKKKTIMYRLCVNALTKKEKESVNTELISLKPFKNTFIYYESKMLAICLLWHSTHLSSKRI